MSLFFLSDGDTVRALSPAQDFKRAYDGDAGPNTGGMGAYSPLPWLAEQFGSEQAFVEEVTRDVALPVVRQLDAEGTPFIGLLYAGLILTPNGVRVIEFNARFGDPETQVVLPRLQTPLSQLLFAAASGTLEDQPEPEFRDDAAITVVPRARATRSRRRPAVRSRAWTRRPRSRVCAWCMPRPRVPTRQAPSSPRAAAC